MCIPTVMSVALGRGSTGHVSNSSPSIFQLTKVSNLQVSLRIFGRLFVVSRAMTILFNFFIAFDND